MTQMTKQDIGDILFSYIRDTFDVADEGFSHESDLFEDGYVDSIHLEAFFSFIETTFDLILEEDHFFDERITTVSGIAEIIFELKEANI